MSLEQVGARLLADGVQQYISQMTGASRATEQVGEAGDKAAGNLANFNRATSGLTVTLGDVLNIGRSVVGMFTGMAQEVIGVISANERISMSMESLIAREYRTADATLSMEDALAKAGPRAEELLGWIRQLAIESPFDQEGVAMAFKTAQTYGFTSEEAQRLTSALINFAAATGQSSATLNQIAFPLGQLRNSGKALTQDLRQLVTAGVDVTGILKKLGFTWEDVSAGAVASDAFLKEFVSTMENDFGNAAERSAGTLEGLINSMGDLKQLSLLELFGPLKEQLVPILGEVVTRMQQFIPAIGMVGEKLGQMAAFIITNKEEIGKFLLALGAGVATFYLIINAGTIYAGVMALATTVTAGLGAAIAFLLSPIGLVAAAIAGLVALFVFSFDEMQAITAQTASQNEARFGEMSDKMAQSSAQATSQVTSDWGEMGDKIAQTAAQRQEESHGWGYNLIINFAQGMADALIAVINVLIELGNMIAAWLSPGSPPKITPDIDEWGTDAMNEFLHGFTRADFGILSTLSGSIEGFIRDLSPGTEVDEAGVIPRVLGTKAAIAEALNQMRQTGKVGEEAFKKIFDALGVANPEVESYVRSMFRVEQATQAVAKAQQRVNDITKKYSEALSPLQKELSEIEKFQREEGRKDREKELQAIIADANAPVEAIQRAQAELRQIQLQRQVEAVEAQRDAELETANAALDKAKAEEQAAKAQMDAQKMLIDAMMENNKLIKKQIELMAKLAEQGKEAGGGAGGAGGPKAGGGGGKPTLPAGGGIGGLPAIPKPGDMFGGFKETIDGLMEDLAKPFDGVKDKLAELKTTWARVFLGIKDEVMGPFNAGLQGEVDTSRGIIGDFSNLMGRGIAEIGPFWDNLKLTVSAFITEAKENAGPLWDQLADIWTLAKGRLDELWNGLTLTIDTFIQWLGPNVIDPWNANVDEIRATWETGKTNLEELWNGFQLTLDAFIQWFNTNIVEVWRSNIENIKNAWAEGKKDIEEKWEAFKSNIETVWQNIKKAVGTAMNEVVTKIKEKVDEVKTWIRDQITGFYNAGRDMIQGLIDGAGSLGQALINALSGLVQAAMDAMLNVIQPGSPSKVTTGYGRTLPQGLALGAEQEGPAAKKSIQGVVRSIMSGIETTIATTPISVPGRADMYARPQSSVVNHNNITGVANANLYNGMDLAAINAQIENTIISGVAIR